MFNIPGIFGLQHECRKLDLWPGHRSLHKTVLGSDGKSPQPGNNCIEEDVKLNDNWNSFSSKPADIILF